MKAVDNTDFLRFPLMKHYHRYKYSIRKLSGKSNVPAEELLQISFESEPSFLQEPSFSLPKNSMQHNNRDSIFRIVLMFRIDC